LGACFLSLINTIAWHFIIHNTSLIFAPIFLPLLFWVLVVIASWEAKENICDRHNKMDRSWKKERVSSEIPAHKILMMYLKSNIDIKFITYILI
jgi:hypothetical protein